MISPISDAIDSFKGEFFFLSNMYTCIVVYRGVRYRSSEHAYQAQKTNDRVWKKRIRSTANPYLAKAMAKLCPKREDWAQIKRFEMSQIVQAKFVQNADIRKFLINTGKRELIEGNEHGDTYWGVCHGRGRNELGQILMDTRLAVAALERFALS